MDILYLDYNCFQRGFDDSRQKRIRLEAAACQIIFQKAEKGEVKLAWSFMHEDETELCPFPERRYEVVRLSSACKLEVPVRGEIRLNAKVLQLGYRLSAKDAVHIACALFSGADYFITCDDLLVKRLENSKLEMKISNPVDYIQG